MAIAAILAGGGDSKAAQRCGEGLPDLVERLALTPAGAPGWLERLGAHVGSRRQTERLLIVNSVGKTLLEVEGSDQQVVVPNELDARFSREVGGIVMVHNHPAGTGLSARDLKQLSRTGVSAIAAIGHDGSVHVAAAGRRYRRFRFEREQYRIVATEVEHRLPFYFRRTSTPWTDLFEHVVGCALEQASVIEYRAFLSPRIRSMYESVAADVDQTVALAAQKLER